ncbi:MAG TPA: glycosyltransferase family 4 protein [Acidimicrobiales bacterium]|nr:glycosyltransferase family 4 protein [Acidimicrobiales bacterium]
MSAPTAMGTGRRLRVEAIVSGRLVASSRFRVLQHVDPLHGLGIDVDVHPPRLPKYVSLPPSVHRHPRLVPAARGALKAVKVATRVPSAARSWRADVTWLERELLPGHLTLERVLHRPLLFDVDDAIWRLPGHERPVREIAARSACVLAGNDFLADWFSSVATEVERVWTAVDTERFTPGPPVEPFTVGWTGSASTLRYLERLAEPLARFLDAAPEARLVVMADMAPTLAGIPGDRLDFVRWSPEVEASSLRRFSVGVMPLPDTDWGRGKCAFKMLQYLACGVPALVSPVGMGRDIVEAHDVGLVATSDDDWVEALLALRADRDRAADLGRRGRELAEASFSLRVIAAQLADCMRRHG